MRRKRSFPVISEPSAKSDKVQTISDDEANADLSMEIIAKAGSREFHHGRSQSAMAPGKSSDFNFIDGLIVISDDDESSRGSDVHRDDKADKQKANEVTAKVEDSPSTSDLPIATPADAQQLADIDGVEQPPKKGKKKKRKTKKKSAADDMDDSKKPEKDILFKEIADDGEDNLAMRELLRGPRYFDLPEEKVCFRCGNVGHLVADCTEEGRKKACYVCGSHDHEQKDCPQGSCFICGGTGHFAKSCPNKANQSSKVRDYDKICLRCGFEGHEMNMCDKDYCANDLKVIQCYVCKKFGHLCCADVVDTSNMGVSCYSCGELGHTGVGCAKRRSGDADDKQPSKFCYKCGEEGHFARGCGKREEELPDPQTPQMRTYRKEEHFLGYKSVPAAAARSHWLDLQLEERRAYTPAGLTWPERWNMARGTDRWGIFPANGLANESPWFDETNFHHERYTQDHSGGSKKRRWHASQYDDQSKDRRGFFHRPELDTPGSSRRNFKRRR